jgi:hypothetical protein
MRMFLNMAERMRQIAIRESGYVAKGPKAMEIRGGKPKQTNCRKAAMAEQARRGK